MVLPCAVSGFNCIGERPRSSSFPPKFSHASLVLARSFLREVFLVHECTSTNPESQHQESGTSDLRAGSTTWWRSALFGFVEMLATPLLIGCTEKRRSCKMVALAVQPMSDLDVQRTDGSQRRHRGTRSRLDSSSGALSTDATAGVMKQM